MTLLIRLFSVAIILFSTTAMAAQVCKGSTTTTADDQFDVGDDSLPYVNHLTTGLTWSRCLLGQTWNAETKSCDGKAVRLSWQNALNSAVTYELGSFTDWRLPNIKELVSLVERECVDPAINMTIFPNSISNGVWSSTPMVAIDLQYQAWAVAFNNGRLDHKDKMADFYVRMVRYAE